MCSRTREAGGTGSLLGGNGSFTFTLADRLSIRVLLDRYANPLGSQAHLPFGEESVESGTQEKHHFATYESDPESGTEYADNRQYAQAMGRFMRVDPTTCNMTKPQALNRYGYALNDCVDLSDPNGLDAVPGPLAPRDAGSSIDAQSGYSAGSASRLHQAGRVASAAISPGEVGDIAQSSDARTFDRIQVTVSNTTDNNYGVEAFGHRDTPQWPASYAGSFVQVPAGGAAILYNGRRPAVPGPIGGPIPWTHCGVCPLCVNPKVCVQRFYKPGNTVIMNWYIVPVPVV